MFLHLPLRTVGLPEVSHSSVSAERKRNGTPFGIEYSWRLKQVVAVDLPSGDPSC